MRTLIHGTKADRKLREQDLGGSEMASRRPQQVWKLKIPSGLMHSGCRLCGLVAGAVVGWAESPTTRKPRWFLSVTKTLFALASFCAGQTACNDAIKSIIVLGLSSVEQYHPNCILLVSCEEPDITYAFSEWGQWRSFSCADSITAVCGTL